MALSDEERLEIAQLGLGDADGERLSAIADAMPGIPINHMVYMAQQPGIDPESEYSKLIKVRYEPLPEKKIAVPGVDVAADGSPPDPITDPETLKADTETPQAFKETAMEFADPSTALPFAPLWTPGSNVEDVANKIVDGQRSMAIAKRREAEELARQEENQDWSDNMFIAPIKGFVRQNMAVMNMPMQLLNNTVTSVGGAWSGANDFSLESFADSFDFIAMVKNYDNQGDGWFGLGGEAGEMQADASADLYYDAAHEISTRQKDPETGYLIPGSGEKIPVNVGGTMNEVLSEKIGYEADSTVGSIVSGVTNFAWYAGMDPLMYANPSKAITAITKSTKGYKSAVDASARIRRGGESQDMLRSTVSELDEGIEVQKAARAEAAEAGKDVTEWDQILDVLETRSQVGHQRLALLEESDKFIVNKNKAKGLDKSPDSMHRTDGWSTKDLDEYAEHMRVWNAENPAPGLGAETSKMTDLHLSPDATDEMVDLWNRTDGVTDLDPSAYRVQRQHILDGKTSSELDDVRYAQDTYTGRTREMRLAQHEEAVDAAADGAMLQLDDSIRLLKEQGGDAADIAQLEKAKSRLVRDRNTLLTRMASGQEKAVEKASKTRKQAVEKATKETETQYGSSGKSPSELIDDVNASAAGALKGEKRSAKWSNRPFEAALDAAQTVQKSTAQGQLVARRTLEKYGVQSGQIVDAGRAADGIRVLSRRAKAAQEDSVKRLNIANEDLKATKADADDLAEKIRTSTRLQEQLGKIGDGDSATALRQLLDNQVGLSSGLGVDSDKFFKTVFGGKWEYVLDVISKEKSSATIREMGRGKISNKTAVDLAKADTTEKVRDIVARDFGLATDGIAGKVKNIRVKARTAEARKQADGATVLNNLQAKGYTKLSNYDVAMNRLVPWSHTANLFDGESTVKAFDDYVEYVFNDKFMKKYKSVTGKNLRDVKKQYLSELMEAGTVGQRRAVIGRALSDLGGGTIRDDKYRELLQGQIDTALKRSGDDVVAGTKTGVEDTLAAAEDAFTDQILSTSGAFNLPDVRQFREIVRKGRELHDRGKLTHSKEYLVNSLDTLFRTSMLVNPRYVVRNLIEGGTRMFLRGDTLENPASFINRVFYGNKAGNYGVDAAGRKWEEIDLYSANVDSMSDADRMIMSVIHRGHSSLDPNNQPRLSFAGRSKVGELTPGGRGYSEALATRLAELKGSMLHDDVIQVTREIRPQRIDDYMATKGIDGLEEGLVKYYSEGPGRKVFDMMGEDDALIKSAMAGDADEFVRRTLLGDSPGSVKSEVKHVLAKTGEYDKGMLAVYDQILRKRPKEGLKGKKDAVLRESTYNVQDATKQLSKMHKNNHWLPTEVGNLPKVSRRGVAGGDKTGAGQAFIDRFFEFAGKTEDVTMWQPAAQKSYWKAIVEYAGSADKAAQAKILKSADQALGKTSTFTGGNKLARDLKYNTKESGSLTFDEIHGIAARRGMEETKALFYDAFEKKQYWNAVRYVVPFGQAWSNTNATMAKLAAQPATWRQLHKVSVAQGALEGPEHWTEEEWSEQWREIMKDPSRAPAIYPHPMYGTKMIEVPILGDVMSWAGGDSGMLSVSTPVSSLSPATQNPLSPGLGPLVAGPANTLNNYDWWRETPQMLREAVTPFPTGSSGVVGDTLGNFVPSYAKRALSIFNPALAQNEINAATVAISNYLVAKYPERYDVNEAGQVGNPGALVEDAMSMATRQTITRGLITAGFPGTAQMDWKLETQDGEVTTYQVMAQDDWYSMLEENAGDTGLTIREFERTYGPQAYWSILGKSNTKGVPVTNEVAEFMSENPGEVGKHRNVTGMFFPYDPTISPTAFYDSEASALLKAEDMKSFNAGDKDAAHEMIEKGNRTLAMLHTAWVRDLEYQGVPASTISEIKGQVEDNYDMIDSTFEVGGFSATDKEVDRALEGPLGDTAAGMSAKEYRRMRNEAYAQVGGDLNGDEKKVIRENLRQLGEGIAKRNPEFKRLWNGHYRDEVQGDWIQ